MQTLVPAPPVKFLTEKEKIRNRLPCSQAQMSYQKVLQMFAIFFPRL